MARAARARGAACASWRCSGAGAGRCGRRRRARSRRGWRRDDFAALVERALFLDRDDPVAAWGELRDAPGAADRAARRARASCASRPRAPTCALQRRRAARGSTPTASATCPPARSSPGPLEDSRGGPHPLHDPLEPARRGGRGDRARASATGAWSRRAPSAARSTCATTLATDDGASRLGEIGIGTNFGIDRPVGHDPVRREDRRHRPPRGRPLLSRDRRHERVGGPLGHDLRPARRRPPQRRRGDAAGDGRFLDESAAP